MAVKRGGGVEAEAQLQPHSWPPQHKISLLTPKVGGFLENTRNGRPSPKGELETKAHKGKGACPVSHFGPLAKQSLKPSILPSRSDIVKAATWHHWFLRTEKHVLPSASIFQL